MDYGNSQGFDKLFSLLSRRDMFLKSIDASHIVSFADTLYELFKPVVEEVGERNVIQVMTNYTQIHVAAGNKLTETFPILFWTSCSSQCMEATLEDMSNLKENLRAMVISAEWLDSSFSRMSAGVLIIELICSLPFWSSCVAIIRITEPLLQVLKLVENNKKPAMGYIHLAIYQVKHRKKKELVWKADYMTYWEIIDWRWIRQLTCPLYAAAFFLNPRFFIIQGDISNEISSGVLDCIEKLVPDANIQDKVQKALSLYKSSSGDFGRKMAIRARNTTSCGVVVNLWRLLACIGMTNSEFIGFYPTITRARFEEFNMYVFKKCRVEKCLRDMKMGKSNVDDVMLVSRSMEFSKSSSC
ncbi:hypothetical protein ZIOFF_057574 [Zingiber officinale]|uniref:DUF659 domain-containing protein n=1 Tax=Zingiber officinale TaxID=94328 RepID=A0A8J5F3J0_ZINOF|nr:hypothetical protein ZIOFF_057574 [Zingiber officinale]